jgi:hypothetical protein
VKEWVEIKVEFGPEGWKQGLQTMGLIVVACLLSCSPVWLILAIHYAFFA